MISRNAFVESVDGLVSDFEVVDSFQQKQLAIENNNYENVD